MLAVKLSRYLNKRSSLKSDNVARVLLKEDLSFYLKFSHKL